MAKIGLNSVLIHFAVDPLLVVKELGDLAAFELDELLLAADVWQIDPLKLNHKDLSLVPLGICIYDLEVPWKN